MVHLLPYGIVPLRLVLPEGGTVSFFDGGPVIQVERLFMNQVATWVSIRTLSVEGRVRNHSAIAPT